MESFHQYSSCQKKKFGISESNMKIVKVIGVIFLICYIAGIVFLVCSCKGVGTHKRHEWNSCMHAMCNQKCKQAGGLGGEVFIKHVKAKVITCLCIHRNESDYDRYSFDETGCGPRPK